MGNFSYIGPPTAQGGFFSDASFQGPMPAAAAGAAGGGALGALGPVMAIVGAVTSAIGSFYQASSERNRLKAEASSMQFQSLLSGINASRAEEDAQATLEAGNREVGRLTMAAGAQKSARTAAMAARGVRLGTGSTAEVQATGDLFKEIDALTLNRNAVRAANAARMRATNFRAQGLIQRVSADNLRRTARSINPWLAAGTSLIGGASQVGTQWAQNQRGTYYGRS